MCREFWLRGGGVGAQRSARGEVGEGEAATETRRHSRAACGLGLGSGLEWQSRARRTSSGGQRGHAAPVTMLGARTRWILRSCCVMNRARALMTSASDITPPRSVDGYAIQTLALEGPRAVRYPCRSRCWVAGWGMLRRPASALSALTSITAILLPLRPSARSRLKSMRVGRLKCSNCRLRGRPVVLRRCCVLAPL